VIYQHSVTVAVALAAIVGAAHASPLTPADTSKAYAACMDQSGGVTSEMEDCISGEFELQDRRLNRSYKALMASIPEKRLELRDAQRKWIAFRDANCGFYYDAEGGSAARLAWSSSLRIALMNWKLSKPGWARRLRNIGVTSSSGTASGSMVLRPRFIRDRRRATIAPGIRGPIPASASRAFTTANRLRSHPPLKHREIEALADQGDKKLAAEDKPRGRPAARP
jgi:uncharacterized protein YecT (DUF1311 family)